MAEQKPTTDPYADETWKPVVGWEGLYEVSDHGRVRSLDRMVTETSGLVRKSAGRVLKPGKVRGKHLYVNLCPLNSGTGERSCVYVHRLVAEAFIGPIPDGMFVLHWDDDPSNNRVENLRIGTITDNSADSIRNGRNYRINQTHCKRGHEFNDRNTAKNGPTGRGCLSCKRARGYIQNHPELKPHFQKVSDSYYEDIMR